MKYLLFNNEEKNKMLNAIFVLFSCIPASLNKLNEPFLRVKGSVLKKIFITSKVDNNIPTADMTLSQKVHSSVSVMMLYC